MKRDINPQDSFVAELYPKRSKGVISGKLLSYLTGHRGYLVPRETLSRYAYQGLDSSYELELVQKMLTDMRSRLLVDPGVLFCARGIGWAIGVNSLLLPPDKLKLNYLLWDQSNVSHEDLSRGLYGRSGDAGLDHMIKSHVFDLRRIYKKNQIPLAIVNEFQKGYRLVEA